MYCYSFIPYFILIKKQSRVSEVYEIITSLVFGTYVFKSNSILLSFLFKGFQHLWNQ